MKVFTKNRKYAKALTIENKKKIIERRGIMTSSMIKKKIIINSEE